MTREKRAKDVVLVGVLKSKQDLRILRKQLWYRIPLRHAPRRRFQYVAFYQPAIFGTSGKSIRYFGRVWGMSVHTRQELLPQERKHPRAREKYLKVEIEKVQKLSKPIRNRRFPARRISFGFTTLRRLLSARNILELYSVKGTEEMLARALLRAKIPFVGQKYVGATKKGKQRRFFLDFAIACARGSIAIECDNDKAHASPKQHERDTQKDNFLRTLGWHVLRFQERHVASTMPSCLARIQKRIAALGGVRAQSLQS